MSYNTYPLNPIETIQPKKLELRSLYLIDVHWNCEPPPNPSKAYKLYVKVKPHVEYMIHLFGVLSTDELYTLKQSNIPTMFIPIIDKFYDAKKSGGFVTKVELSSYELFNYANKSSFAVPKQPIHKQFTLVPKVPKITPNIPVATQEQIQAFARKA